MCSTEPAAEHLQKIASAPSSSLSLLLLLISPMFVFRSNSKGFEESKSIISFSLSHFHRFYFLFRCFFCLSQFCSIFFLLLLKKNYCVCVKHKVFCNCLCSSSLLLLVTLPTLSRISGNSEQKTILQTTEQLIQYIFLEIQFRSLKYRAVFRIGNNLSNFPFLSKRYEARTMCWCIQPTPNSLQTLQTLYTCSNCMRNQYCIANKCFSQYL